MVWYKTMSAFMEWQGFKTVGFVPHWYKRKQDHGGQSHWRFLYMRHKPRLPRRIQIHNARPCQGRIRRHIRRTSVPLFRMRHHTWPQRQYHFPLASSIHWTRVPKVWTMECHAAQDAHDAWYSPYGWWLPWTGASSRVATSLDLDLAFGAVDVNDNLACTLLLSPLSPLPPLTASPPCSAAAGQPIQEFSLS